MLRRPRLLPHLHRASTPAATPRSFALGFALFSLAAAGACQDNAARPNPHEVGDTEFTTLELGNGTSRGGPGKGGVLTEGAAAPTAGSASGGSSGTKANDSGAPAPSGRVADVQEADVYKMQGTKLLYLNTYRGLTIYDVADPTKPAQLSRLPVYGYPIEMFVEGNTVYALLRDALYLTQIDGKVQFQRHNVSQLVTIDITDMTQPKVLKTVDIVGDLHEGVSRKVENTIYVVSEQYGYYWGWVSQDITPPESQAWVYSFDVSDAKSPRLAGQLQVFKGGNYNTYDEKTGASSSRNFSGVAISATSNALMVVENWYDYDSNGKVATNGCGSWSYRQEAVTSLIDISDPTGNIRLHTRFTTEGSLADQFKMTYVPDAATGTGTFYGIFATQNWDTCSGSTTQNELESWDVTDGGHPAKLATLSFGKPGETVAATSFDLKRNVAYAITSRQIDPLYAIDISNRKAPQILSAIDGLSGSVSVFRQVADGQFLLGVGRDQSDTCTGYQDGAGGWQSTKMALSVIDVRDTRNIKLVQRKCIDIKNAGWSWSQLTWNQDQGHKMLGMFEDGNTNIFTMPVSYYIKEDLAQQLGWWYHWETAVGILTWDLSLYDPTKAPADQKVIQTYGTFVHPQGEVERSILFRHPVTGNRTMINLSDTHLSIANLQDLNAPALQAVVEVAPEISGIYGFDNYLVERVEVGEGQWYAWDKEMSEFRVKKAGGPVDDRAPVATFQVGQVSSVHRYKNNLVVMRRIVDPTGQTTARSEAVIFDLTNPAAPKAVGRLDVPFEPYYFYGFYCGMDSFYRGYWFGNSQSLVTTDAGLVQLRTVYQYQTTGNYYTYDQVLNVLDLRDPTAPKLIEKKIGTFDSRTSLGWWDSLGLVADPAAPSGFYVTRRKALEQVKMADNTIFTRFGYYAQRFDVNASGLVEGDETNLPGPLTQTWKNAADERFFLTQSADYRTISYPERSEWHMDTKVSLLRALSSAKAELLDSKLFTDINLSSMVVDGSRVYVAGQKQYYWWYYDAARAANPPTWESTSDRLMIFDTAAGKLTSLYDQPTRTYGVQLMGTHGGKLFVNVPGDGMLMVDASNRAAPQGQKFLRTLGYASSLEFAGNDAYQSSGNFGVFNMNLSVPSTLPREVLTTGP